MKLIIQGNSIAGTATDDYQGPEQFITAPDGFDPSQMQNYSIINGEAVITLATAQGLQMAILAAAYQNAISQPVSYTSKGGVAETFQADPGSTVNLQSTILGLQITGTTPTGFYWIAADNTQVPFTYADLQGLAETMLVQRWTAFQHLQAQKTAVNSATTVSGVMAVTW